LKKQIVTLAVLIIFSLTCLSQVSHVSLIYDFEGDDFDYPVTGMAGANDSLYIICNTPDGHGKFFKIDEHGNGYKVIWEFDNVNFEPNSLLADDNVIYGTTRFSLAGGGTLFAYSLNDYSFKFIKDFNPTDVQEIHIKFIADDVLWLYSNVSLTDLGSIFSIKTDGTGFKKVFNDTDFTKGQNPVDFCFYNDNIYIACYNGGGNLYPDGTGAFGSGGCFIRVSSDGSGYENLVKGGDDKGTQPQSIIIRENKLFGLFANSGSNQKVGGQFFRSNLNGTSYDSLGALSRRSLTRMLSTDSLIYGISFSQVFGINPFNGEIRIFDELLFEPDFGYDMVTNPVLLNGSVYLAAQQGGPDNGGTILKWNNEKPEIKEKSSRNYQIPTKIVLSDLFSDPEGDSLTYTIEFDSNAVEMSESNGKLIFRPLQSGEVEVRITANDGWAGYKSYSMNISSITDVLNPKDNPENLLIYPNPTNSFLNMGSENVESVEILTLNGNLIQSIRNPGTEINISTLENGVYIIRYQIKGCFNSQKIIKY
jgi:hypothetical protein